MIDTYRSHELYEYEKLTLADLLPPKVSVSPSLNWNNHLVQRRRRYKYLPFLYASEPRPDREYREFLLRHRLLMYFLLRIIEFSG